MARPKNKPAAAASAAEELRGVLGIGRRVAVGERSIEVRAFRFEQLFDVLAVALPIVDLLIGHKADILAALRVNRGAVLELIALATGLGAAELGALPIADGMRLAFATFEENRLFFVSELVPIAVQLHVQKTAKSSSSATMPPPAAAATSGSDTGSSSPTG